MLSRPPARPLRPPTSQGPSVKTHRIVGFYLCGNRYQRRGSADVVGPLGFCLPISTWLHVNETGGW